MDLQNCFYIKNPKGNLNKKSSSIYFSHILIKFAPQQQQQQSICVGKQHNRRGNAAVHVNLI